MRIPVRLTGSALAAVLAVGATAFTGPAHTERPQAPQPASSSAVASADAAPKGPRQPHGLTEAARLASQVTRSTVWTQTQRIHLDFDTYHPQGMAVVGDRIYLSSVEIIEPTQKFAQPQNGMDRTAGKGRGHLFVLDRQGNLLQDVRLGEGDIYHPGGIDFDGRKLWVPVAEYRPHSRSIVYTVDPETLQVHEGFRADDHVGGVVADPRRGTVHGVSWGSRDLFTWSPRGRLLDRTANPSHFIDYQDCEHAGGGSQLCFGMTDLKDQSGRSFPLGGFALTDLRTNAILHEVPVTMTSAAGHTVTRNPVSLQVEDGALTMYAAPDDAGDVNGTELLIYRARL